jgi:hypothetical protein
VQSFIYLEKAQVESLATERNESLRKAIEAELERFGAKKNRTGMRVQVDRGKFSEWIVSNATPKYPLYVGQYIKGLDLQSA